MELKDWMTLAGLSVTLGLGIYNFYSAQVSAQRARIVAVITDRRLKWGILLQDLVSESCGAGHYLRFSTVKGSDEERKKMEEIDRLRYLIPLNLCERTPIEKEVEEQVLFIASASSGHSHVSDEDFGAG